MRGARLLLSPRPRPQPPQVLVAAEAPDGSGPVMGCVVEVRVTATARWSVHGEVLRVLYRPPAREEQDGSVARHSRKVTRPVAPAESAAAGSEQAAAAASEQVAAAVSQGSAATQVTPDAACSSGASAASSGAAAQPAESCGEDCSCASAAVSGEGAYSFALPPALQGGGGSGAASLLELQQGAGGAAGLQASRGGAVDKLAEVLVFTGVIVGLLGILMSGVQMLLQR